MAENPEHTVTRISIELPPGMTRAELATKFDRISVTLVNSAAVAVAERHELANFLSHLVVTEIPP